MYQVTIREYVRTTSPYAKKPYRCSSRFTMTTDDSHTVAERARDTMRVAGKGMRFSGMEDGGEAHDFWNDGHECPESGEPSDECESLELDACRDYVESDVEQMSKGSETDYHLSGPDGFTDFTVKCK